VENIWSYFTWVTETEYLEGSPLFPRVSSTSERASAKTALADTEKYIKKNDKIISEYIIAEKIPITIIAQAATTIIVIDNKF